MSCLHQDVESLFSELIHSLEGTFSLAEIMEVRSFLDYGEYGIALETLTGIIIEENKMISNNIFDSIGRLSSLMDMERLQNTVNEELVKFKLTHLKDYGLLSE